MPGRYTSTRRVTVTMDKSNMPRRPHMVSLIGCRGCSWLCVGDAWAFTPTAATVDIIFVAVFVREPMVLGWAQPSQPGVGG